jgi:predicted HicB family RNase H-like nuclease
MKKLFDEDVRLSIAHMRRTGHRVTYDEHIRSCRALGVKPRMGRPPKGEEKYVSVGLRLPPEVLAHVKAKAHKQGIKYQTFITQVLRAA